MDHLKQLLGIRGIDWKGLPPVPCPINKAHKMQDTENFSSYFCPKCETYYTLRWVATKRKPKG